MDYVRFSDEDCPEARQAEQDLRREAQEKRIERNGKKTDKERIKQKHEEEEKLLIAKSQ
jgi:hypothetical protein